MGKSTPQAPAPPDPVATANAQANANTQAAITQAGLNRINQVTPQGSLTYSQNGVDANGIPQYTQTFQYSPEQQALYNQQNQIAQSLGGLATNNIQRVSDAQSQAFNFDGMTPLQTGVQSAPLQYGPGSAGVIQTTFGTGGPLTSNVQAGQVQNGLNFGQQFNPGDFNATAQAARDASYQQAASRLDPQYQQMQSDLTSRLANSGIAQGSEAYNREMDNFARQRTDAYNQANYASQAAGLAAQQQGYQQQLATRGQQVGETTTQGQFANTAQNQQFQQGQQNAALNNAAQGQQYQQNLGAAQFGNAAQDQQYQQQLANAGFYNQAQNQQFNQSAANATMNNQARQQQIDEATYLRNLPLNDIAALLGTGGGVQQANFNPFAQVGVAAPDYQGAVYANYNAANQQYQQQMAARSQGLGSIFGALGSLGGAAIMSDRRMKDNLKQIGTLANGVATYAFNYIGSSIQQFGVMAQDVLHIPGAVKADGDGIMYVDYGKVW